MIGLLESEKSHSGVVRASLASVLPCIHGRDSSTVRVLNLQPGELVEIRSTTEIISTLDKEGRLDGLPFMPEMLAFCGRRFRVSRRSDSTCALGQPRRIEATVHLAELRCDGSGHRNCDAGCLLFWKEAWLRRVEQQGVTPTSLSQSVLGSNGNANADVNGSYKLLRRLAEKSDSQLMCQSTELQSATCPLAIGNPPAYIAGIARDIIAGKKGKANLRSLANYCWGKLILFAFTRWARAPWNSYRYRKTPEQSLSLRAGEWVQVRRTGEILRTLDRNGCNRGMEFKAEMFRFCGGRYKVIANMERRIDERTGELRGFRNPCIVLEGVKCDGQRSFCTRGNYHYWREIWLTRA